MGVLFMASGDTQDISVFNWTNFLSASTTKKRTGTYSYYAAANGGGFIKSFTATTEGYFRIACNVAVEIRMYLRDSEGNAHLELRLRPSVISVYRYSTLLGSSGINNNTEMIVLECHWLINNSTGVCQVKVNGELVIDFTGDTQETVNAEVSELYVRTYYAGSSAYFDDIIIRDDQWPGRGGIHVLKPNAGSTNENWTASAGNPEDCIDDIPASYTDYIYTDALIDNTEHLVGIESLPTTSNAINGVGVIVKGKLDVASTAYLATLLKSGTTTDAGSSVSVDSNDTCIQTFYNQNPDDAAAFEDADIDALEVGVETVVP